MKNKLSFNKLLHSNCGLSLRSLSFTDFDDFENLVSHNEAVEHSLSAKIVQHSPCIVVLNESRPYFCSCCCLETMSYKGTRGQRNEEEITYVLD